ncbi:metallophosphoesterase [Albidovulum sediminis]|uniref:Metallophosphoesterase n=1 Tax=Albidovulum sediminis TaxID=3066345 RepID=A0ABT2NRS6_9RHOB|nr:metallophosphoesterase [Defluviimonas sediminis]MCT8331411.1 metallophosphoesterase [Defluviimonas sediminis]
MRTYAIGDIHGYLDKLESAHRLISRDRAEHDDTLSPVVHVGDMVDRGPDSRGVLDFLLAGLDRGEPWVILKGNHDRMFAGFLDDPDHHDAGLRADLNWIHPRLGGEQTLASYGVTGVGERFLSDLGAAARRAVPAAHRDFLAALPTSFARGEALFVHAGIRPGVPLARQTETDLVWIRSPFLEDPRDHGALVVHGHTPVDVATHYGNRLNIDTGAGYGNALSAIVLEGRDAFLLTPQGRVPLRHE